MLIADASAYSLRTSPAPSMAARRAAFPAAGWNIATPSPEANSSIHTSAYPGSTPAPAPGKRRRRRAPRPTAASAARPTGAEPTVLVVGRLLREVIIALAEGQTLDPEDRADLHRIALRRLTPTPTLQHYLPAPADPRLRDVAAILANDPADGRTLAELGRAAGASERTLSRLFRRDTGMTFPQWRAQLRLQHAIILLAAGGTVTGAATASGYTNASAFIAAFRDAFGITPAAYRHETT